VQCSTGVVEEWENSWLRVNGDNIITRQGVLVVTAAQPDAL